MGKMRVDSIIIDKRRLEFVIGSLFRKSLVCPSRAFEIYKKIVN